MRRLWSILCMLWACSFAATVHAAVKADSPAWQELMSTTLGADASLSFQWSALLRREGHPQEALQLQKLLVWRLLQQAAGETPDASVTIGQALATGAALPSVQVAHSLLDDALTRHLEVRFLSASVPPPSAWARQSGDVQEVGPGLWLRPDRHPGPRPMGLVVDLAYRGQVPLWVNVVDLHASGAQWPFRCGFGGEPIGLLTQGQVKRVECAGVALADAADPRVQAVLRAFRVGSGTALRVAAYRHPQRDDLARIGPELERALLAGHRDAAMFMQRNAHCERRHTCVAASPRAADPPPAKQRRFERPEAAGLLLATVVWLYFGVAMMFGNSRARVIAFCLVLFVAAPLLFQVGAAFGGLFRHADADRGVGIVLAAIGSPFIAVLVVWPMHALFRTLLDRDGWLARTAAAKR